MNIGVLKKCPKKLFISSALLQSSFIIREEQVRMWRIALFLFALVNLAFSVRGTKHIVYHFLSKKTHLIFQIIQS